MRGGLWLVLEDIDRASSDVLGSVLPLVESFRLHKAIGAPAELDVPGHGTVQAAENFLLFATRSVVPHMDGSLPSALFLGSSKYFEIEMPAPSEEELLTIISGKFPSLGINGARAVIRAWSDALSLGSAPGIRDIGIHELETWCRRVETLVSANTENRMDVDNASSFSVLCPHVATREEMFLQARDIYFGAGAFSDSARSHVVSLTNVFAQHLGLDSEHVEWVLHNRVPKLRIDRDENGQPKALQIGNNRLHAADKKNDLLDTPHRPFALHRPALLIMERIAASVSHSEPVLLVGETGTGKTTIISHVASSLNKNLISLNLSHQTESSDLIGGFKPVDARIPAGELQRQFLELFGRTYSRRKNNKFEDAVRRALNDSKWKRLVGLWKESARVAVEKILSRGDDQQAALQR